MVKISRKKLIREEECQNFIEKLIKLSPSNLITKHSKSRVFSHMGNSMWEYHLDVPEQDEIYIWMICYYSNINPAKLEITKTICDLKTTGYKEIDVKMTVEGFLNTPEIPEFVKKLVIFNVDLFKDYDGYY